MTSRLVEVNPSLKWMRKLTGWKDSHFLKLNTMKELTKKRRTKKVIAEFFPTKKWLTASESCAYLNMSLNKFTVSAIGSTKYYMVSQLDYLIESNIIIQN